MIPEEKCFSFFAYFWKRGQFDYEKKCWIRRLQPYDLSSRSYTFRFVGSNPIIIKRLERLEVLVVL